MPKETTVVAVKTMGTTIATLGPLGYAPVGPGTWGSAAGVCYGAWVQWLAWQAPTGWDGVIRGILVSFALVVAYLSIRHTEALWKTHDDQRIVIDELACQAMVVVALPWSAWHLLFAFVAFRLFDIWKPGPIGWCDRNIPDAFGTLFDDVAAGIAAILSYGAVHFGLLYFGITIGS